MSENTGPKATLLTPGEEHEQYQKFCHDNGMQVQDKGDFYQAAYYLTARALIVGFDEGIASFNLDGATLCLCELDDRTMVLALFKTDEVEKYEALAQEEEEKKTTPIDHLG